MRPLVAATWFCSVTFGLSPALATAHEPASFDWPAWRGPRGDGVADGFDLPTRWDGQTNIAWKTPIDGVGYSSPIVVGEHVFLTTADSWGAWRGVVCLDLRTGQERWRRTIADDDPEVASSMTSHAAATPASDGRRVVAAFGRAGIVCYDLSGMLLWHRSLGRFESELGLASSPVIADGVVYLVCDHDGDGYRSFDSYLLALDVVTGGELWRTPRNGLYRSWSTPLVLGKTLVVSAQDEVRGYDRRSGRVAWSVAGNDGWVAPSPVFAHELIFASSGRAGPLVAIGAAGGLDRDGGELAAIAWQAPTGGAYVCSPIVYGDYLYVHDESGVLSCYHAATGKREYRRRLEGKFYASAVAGDGRLYFLNDAGETHVVRAGPRFELLATNPLGEYALATPAACGGGLLLRTREHLYCAREVTK